MPFARLANWLVVPLCLCLSACSETIVKDVPSTDVNPDSGTEQSQSITDNVIALQPAANPPLSEPAGNEVNAAKPESVNSEDVKGNATTVPGNIPSAVTETEEKDTETGGPDVAGPAPVEPNVADPTVDGPDVAEPTAGGPNSADPTAGVSEEPNSSVPTDPQLSDPPLAEIDDPTGGTEQGADIQLDKPKSEMVVGAPGATADCAQSLPCRWVSDDLQFAVTLTNADNIASRGRLSIQFSVNTLHDSQVSIARPDQAIDSSDQTFQPENQTLGDGNGVSAQPVTAGSALMGSMSFDTASSDNLISSWSTTFLDAGTIRSASFSNIPVGSATTQIADCMNVLPCVWESPNQDVTITLLSVGNLSTANRLTANFSLTTNSDTTVAVDVGSSAVGMDGARFSGRTHSLAGNTSFEKLTATTRSFALLAGSIYFYRTDSTTEFLQDLSLIIYKDEPIPRWNPRFTAVPIL